MYGRGVWCAAESLNQIKLVGKRTYALNRKHPYKYNISSQRIMDAIILCSDAALSCIYLSD